jgi:purine-binding chemotaxis protein CheW
MRTEVAKSTNDAVLGQPAASVNDEGNAAAVLWLFCRVGSHSFALPTSHVIETMRPLPIEKLSGAPPLVLGLSIVRGNPVPVINAAMLFDDHLTHYERLITIRAGDRTIAIAAEAVLDVQAIPLHELERLPSLLRKVETIEAIKMLDQELVFFLNIARVVPPDILKFCNRERVEA